jgi:phosphorylcholine metabolism protein LicD
MEDKEIKINLLRRVVQVLNENKIDYVIYYGTLLGAIRNNDFIPWDNDIDIMVFNIDKINLLRNEFEKQGLYCITTQHKTISFADAELCKRIDFRAWIEPFIKENGELFVRIDKNISKKNGVTSSSFFFYLFGFFYTILNGVPFKTKSFSYERMKSLMSVTNKIPRKIRNMLSDFFMNLQSLTMDIQYINIPTFHSTPINFCGMNINIPDNAEKHLEIFYGPQWKTPNKNWTTVRDNRIETKWKKVKKNNKEYLYSLPNVE